MYRIKTSLADFFVASKSDLHAASRPSVFITFPCLYDSQKHLQKLSEWVLHHKYVGSTKLLHAKESKIASFLGIARKDKFFHNILHTDCKKNYP